MSRAQWGHGFYRGIEAAKANSSGFVGLFVHIREDSKIQYQLRVEKELPNQMFLLRYFSFLTGEPTKSKIFTLEEMKDFDFYESIDDWRSASDRER